MDTEVRANDVRYLLGAPETRRPGVLAIDEFDGVHVALSRQIARCAEAAAQAGVDAIVVVIWPGATAAGTALTGLDERLERLAESDGIDEVVVAPLGGEAGADVGGLLETMSAWYDVRGLVVRERTSALLTWDELSAASARFGWSLLGIEDEAEPASGIYELIAAGEVAGASTLLGGYFQVRGRVVAGDRRGRLLGFPTANLVPDPRKVLPATGVYAVLVRLPGEVTAIHAGVANIGMRPTFGDTHAPIIEVHLLDTALDLYGMEIAVELVDRLRAEQRFSGVDALRAQIDADARRAREMLASAPRIPVPRRAATEREMGS